jgi:hypothetical protein
VINFRKIDRKVPHGLPFPGVWIFRADSSIVISDWTIRDRIAPYWFLFHNTGPGAVLFQKGEEIELTPDRVVLIAPMTLFSTGIRNVVRHTFMEFSAMPSSNQVYGEIFTIPAGPYLPDLDRPDPDRYVFTLKMYEILFRVLRNIPPESAFPCRGPTWIGESPRHSNS